MKILDDLLDEAVVTGAVAGAVLLIEERGASIYSRSVGVSDREAGVPMAEDTVFRLASITKPIATALFMTLVDDGVFSLDAPVTEWLPDFRPKLVDGRAPEISLHHLLTHTSGLGYRLLEPETGPYALARVSDGLDQPGLALSENLKRIASAPLYFDPGAGWRYSVGLDVMAAVAEAAAGQPLQTLMADRICSKLGLSSLAFHLPETCSLAKPYKNTDSGLAPIDDGSRVPIWGNAGVTFAPSRVHNAASFASAGAGLAGTALDVMKFLHVLAKGDDRLLRRSMLAEMMRPQIAADLQTLQGPGWSFGYGWGVLVDPVSAASRQPAGTLRWGGVYGHSWFFDPHNERIMVLLTNTAYEGMIGKLPARIVDALYGSS